MNRDHAIGFGVGLLAGAVIGGVLGLLFAPQSGKETRQLIKDKTSGFVDSVKDAASEAGRRGQSAVQALKGDNA
jgi:gas vesicle protein